jgi:DNA (cytosine-5)-methyltransferase 1
MQHKAYYNEIDPYAAQWLRNLISRGLIASGDVDERDIRDVRPDDLAGYTQCHFFAGIAGWQYALRLSGWPDTLPVWTGSCPCQPFSTAGKRKGFDDERHLWPAWHKLISGCHPAVVFGEQVARSADWQRLVHGDLEALGYAVGCMPIEAASVGAPHLRDRFWFVADADGQGECAVPFDAEMAGSPQSVADANKPRLEGRVRIVLQERPGELSSGSSSTSKIGGPVGHWITEPDVGRVAHGVPARVAKLRALGNAIVPQVAAEFIRAYRETFDRDVETRA